MIKRVSDFLLCALLFALCLSAEAQQLGLTIPPQLLIDADKVIK